MSQRKAFGGGNVSRTDVGVTEAVSSQDAASRVLTYEPYYGLKAKPFSLSTDPRTLYKSSSHAPVFEDLVAAIRRREGLIVLTGDMGTGKTMLCRAAIYELDRKAFTTFVPDPDLTREDLLRMLLVGFGEVSIHDLKAGRLKGTPRADLSVQLYTFLTSLESVDAFAALVIDEAQTLSTPLLDEIRALSEMEAGRRLLQIVLVGQPELRSRLRRREMQQIAQRVTAVCELRPLSREGVDGYVSHRLASAGGTRDRVEFSSQALDLVFAASDGIPRLVNRICDRALFCGYLDRSSHIGPAHVGRALQELEIAPSRPDPPMATRPDHPMTTRLDQPMATAAAMATPPANSPGGLFVKTTLEQPASSEMDLTALLNLPAVSRRAGEPGVSTRIESSRATTRRATHRSVWWRRALRSVSLPALGMGVMLFAGGTAVSTVGTGTVSTDLPPLPLSPLVSPPSFSRSVVLPPDRRMADLAAAAASPPPDITPALEQTWVVQVGAFSNPARSATLVQQLLDEGWPAFQMEHDSNARGLTVVHVGPYRSAAEAVDVLAGLRATSDHEGAFVRNITDR